MPKDARQASSASECVHNAADAPLTDKKLNYNWISGSKKSTRTSKWEAVVMTSGGHPLERLNMY